MATSTESCPNHPLTSGAHFGSALASPSRPTRSAG